jgi:hypothetical protein
MKKEELTKKMKLVKKNYVFVMKLFVVVQALELAYRLTVQKHAIAIKVIVIKVIAIKVIVIKVIAISAIAINAIKILILLIKQN